MSGAADFLATIIMLVAYLGLAGFVLVWVSYLLDPGPMGFRARRKRDREARK